MATKFWNTNYRDDGLYTKGLKLAGELGNLERSSGVKWAFKAREIEKADLERKQNFEAGRFTGIREGGEIGLRLGKAGVEFTIERAITVAETMRANYAQSLAEYEQAMQHSKSEKLLLQKEAAVKRWKYYNPGAEKWEYAQSAAELIPKLYHDLGLDLPADPARTPLNPKKGPGKGQIGVKFEFPAGGLAAALPVKMIELWHMYDAKGKENYVKAKRPKWEKKFGWVPAPPATTTRIIVPRTPTKPGATFTI